MEMGKTKWRLNREGHYKKAMEGTTVFQTGSSGIRKHLKYYNVDKSTQYGFYTSLIFTIFTLCFKSI
jgi:hypothetical protein